MKRVAIVTDSTAVMGSEFEKNNDNLYVIPLHILFDQDEVYKDGIDLTSEAFFEKINNTEILPTTSQPSVGEVLELFDVLDKEYEEILYITISSKISGTYSTGCSAAKILSDYNIRVFDSLNTSVIQKLYVEEAVRLSNEGKNTEEIYSYLESLREQSEIYLVVDDLRHLGRTGRLNNVSAIIGSLLKIKPILHFEDGLINLKKKVRTLRKAYKEVIDILLNENIDENLVLMIAHANGLENAKKIRDDILSKIPNREIEICELSPVISVHTGPNSVGVAWVRK